MGIRFNPCSPCCNKEPECSFLDNYNVHCKLTIDEPISGFSIVPSYSQSGITLDDPVTINDDYDFYFTNLQNGAQTETDFINKSHWTPMLFVPNEYISYGVRENLGFVLDQSQLMVDTIVDVDNCESSDFGEYEECVNNTKYDFWKTIEEVHSAVIPPSNISGVQFSVLQHYLLDQDNYNNGKYGTVSCNTTLLKSNDQLFGFKACGIRIRYTISMVAYSALTYNDPGNRTDYINSAYLVGENFSHFKNTFIEKWKDRYCPDISEACYPEEFVSLREEGEVGDNAILSPPIYYNMCRLGGGSAGKNFDSYKKITQTQIEESIDNNIPIEVVVKERSLNDTGAIIPGLKTILTFEHK